MSARWIIESADPDKPGFVSPDGILKPDPKQARVFRSKLEADAECKRYITAWVREYHPGTFGVIRP